MQTFNVVLLALVALAAAAPAPADSYDPVPYKPACDDGYKAVYRRDDSYNKVECQKEDYYAPPPADYY